MIVLGVDPSFACTAMVWWNGETVIHFNKFSLPQGPSRLLMAAKRFKRALAPHIDLAIVEGGAIGAPNRKVVAKLSELLGVYKMVLEALDIPYLEVAPTSIKKWLTGSGKAEKHIVAQELARRYGVEFEDDKGMDLSDACALAVWGWETKSSKVGGYT